MAQPFSYYSHLMIEFYGMAWSGLPNVGKSSFFNVLSNTGVYSIWIWFFSALNLAHYYFFCGDVEDLGKAANFPYATINPEEARIPVPDTRFEWLCDVYKPASKVPAFLTCIDIAGLTAVSEAHSYGLLCVHNYRYSICDRVHPLVLDSAMPSYHTLER